MCDCIKQACKLLASRHTEVVITIPLVRGAVSRMLIATQKTHDAPRRTKPVSLVATFCPVCGEKYADALVRKSVKGIEPGPTLIT